ncbi:MAG: endonuclease/exonuclease/phosphatase family protein [Sulfuricella sp.]|nr:endonuclease/exonuclease/phosphatase family protein [Sulfuricella sp.]
MLLKVVTYNIHGGIGQDGRYDPQRILDVIASLDPDICALQEVESLHGQPHLFAQWGEAAGYQVIFGHTQMRQDGAYGNAVLSRLPVAAVRRMDLTFAGREPRGALDVELDCNGVPLRVLATHLGLMPRERRHQIQLLLSALTRTEADRIVLMGDINEWFLWGRPLRWLHAFFGGSHTRRTFPSRWPMFALDRIWTHPWQMLGSVSAHRSPAARIASDHLPLWGEIEIG